MDLAVSSLKRIDEDSCLFNLIRECIPWSENHGLMWMKLGR